MYYSRVSLRGFQSFQGSRGPSLGFCHARTALKHGLVSHVAPDRNHVLVPAFICDVFLHPLDQLGCTYSFFPLSAQLSPDFDRLQGLVSKRTIAVVMVHFFGIPRFVHQYQEFARRNGLLLIEDNAHGYGGIWEGVNLGTLGDISIESPRKLFPIRCGGLLKIQGRVVNSSLVVGPMEPPWAVGVRTLKAWLKSNRFLRRALVARPRYEDPDGFREGYIDEHSMDSKSSWYLSHVDLPKFRKARHRAFETWAELCRIGGLAEAFPVPSEGLESLMPLVFPALCHSRSERNRWLRLMFQVGVDAYTWPSLPDAVLAEKGDAFLLWERLICFPIHEGMRPSAMRRDLSEVFRSEGRKIAPR